MNTDKLKNALGRLKGEKASLFLFFFLFSGILWFLIKLPDSYTTTVKVKARYTRVPEDKLLIDPAREIRIDVNGKGFKLFNLKYFEKEVDIDLSGLRKKGDLYYLPGADLRKQLAVILPGEVELRQLRGDTLFFQLGENIRKEVKIVPRLNISFARDYQLYDSLQTLPGMVEAYGPDVILNELDTLYTARTALKDVSSGIDINIPVDIPGKYSQVEFSAKKVNIRAGVERFSEERLVVPVSVMNIPEQKVLKTFPSEVEIVCEGALKDLRGLSPGDFEVVCDYLAVKDSVEYIPLKVVKKPETVRRVKLSHQQVKILIRSLGQ